MPNPNKITEKVFQSPSKYIQGPNAIKNGARYLSPLGNKPFLVADSFVYDLGQIQPHNINVVATCLLMS